MENKNVEFQVLTGFSISVEPLPNEGSTEIELA